MATPYEFKGAIENRHMDFAHAQLTGVSEARYKTFVSETQEKIDDVIASLNASPLFTSTGVTAEEILDELASGTHATPPVLVDPASIRTLLEDKGIIGGVTPIGAEEEGKLVKTFYSLEGHAGALKYSKDFKPRLGITEEGTPSRATEPAEPITPAKDTNTMGLGELIRHKAGGTKSKWDGLAPWKKTVVYAGATLLTLATATAAVVGILNNDDEGQTRGDGTENSAERGEPSGSVSGVPTESADPPMGTVPDSVLEGLQPGDSLPENAGVAAIITCESDGTILAVDSFETVGRWFKGEGCPYPFESLSSDGTMSATESHGQRILVRRAEMEVAPSTSNTPSSSIVTTTTIDPGPQVGGQSDSRRSESPVPQVGGR